MEAVAKATLTGASRAIGLLTVLKCKPLLLPQAPGYYHYPQSLSHWQYEQAIVVLHLIDVTLQNPNELPTDSVCNTLRDANNSSIAASTGRHRRYGQYALNPQSGGYQKHLMP